MRFGKVLYCSAIWLGLVCLAPTGNLLAQVCGDSNLDAGEECDDGNIDPFDGCDPFCQLELCGNGTPDAGEE